MSWAEIKHAINSNFKKPLNEKLIDYSFSQIYVFENTNTFVPEKNGLYKIICVGAGGEHYNSSVTGGSGGVAIKNIELVQGQSYELSIGRDAIFNDSIFGYGATRYTSSNNYKGKGGIASGGDYNFNGADGFLVDTDTGGVVYNGVSVGVYLHGLSERQSFSVSNRGVYAGYGILGFGFGEGCVTVYDNAYYSIFTPYGKAGIVIIPLEVDG